MEEINIYCDESCHLEHDKSNVMAIGGVWCEKDKIREISNRIKDYKLRHGLKPYEEIKWTKISNCNIQLYEDVVNFFFDCKELHLRCYVADKTKLDHAHYSQTHEDWYYKIYFRTLQYIFDRRYKYNIFLDIRDVHSNKKCKKLREVCSNYLHDFEGLIIKVIQPIRSNESQIMQLTDILIGAITYNNRKFEDDHQYSKSKKRIIEIIKKRSGLSLNKSTFPQEEKVNIYFWTGSKKA